MHRRDVLITICGLRVRVLQVGKYYHPFRGGVETHLQLLCSELRSRVDLDVVVSNTRPLQTTEWVDGVRVTRCLELGKVASTSLCPTMPLELARRRYDVLHLHCPHPVGSLSYLAARPARPHALVVAYHADIVRQRRLLIAYRPFLRMLLARADAIICATPNYRDSSAELVGYRHKVRIIPYGIDLARFEVTPRLELDAAGLRARFGGQPIVLGVGRLVSYKGFEYLVRAMRDVPATLLLAGTGPLRESLEQLARDLAIAQRVHFLGDTDDDTLRACYHACAVFALPSIDRSEAFALVQLEAMAMARPVVNTSIPGSGVPWVSRDGDSGLTVPPCNAEALGEALRKLLSAPQMAAQFGNQGRERVKREFTKQAMAEQTLALYRSIVPSGP